LHNAETTHNTWPIDKGSNKIESGERSHFPGAQKARGQNPGYDNKLCLKLPPDQLQFMALGMCTINLN